MVSEDGRHKQHLVWHHAPLYGLHWSLSVCDLCLPLAQVCHLHQAKKMGLPVLKQERCLLLGITTELSGTLNVGPCQGTVHYLYLWEYAGKKRGGCWQGVGVTKNRHRRVGCPFFIIIQIPQSNMPILVITDMSALLTTCNLAYTWSPFIPSHLLFLQHFQRIDNKSPSSIKQTWVDQPSAKASETFKGLQYTCFACLSQWPVLVA